MPAIQSQEQDRRGRFREIFCSVLEARKDTLPDYRACESALMRVGLEASPNGVPVSLGPAQRRFKVVYVPGLGWDCFANWLGGKETIAAHLRTLGYDMVTVDIDGLSSSTHNARLIRDAILALPEREIASGLVLVGYSKGIVDILSALAIHPELQQRVTAVVSLAGAVGGSPLANDTRDSLLDLMRFFPGASCERTGRSALQDLKPETRQAWLAAHKPPGGIAYYSLVTFPRPEQISNILRGAHEKLSKIDARNDSQLLFYDQFLPGSTLVAYLNADHLAVALPVARTHAIVSGLFLEHNAFPREAMFESLLRLLEEELPVRQ